MGIFDRLKKANNPEPNTKAANSSLGRNRSACPFCGAIFNPVPTRKKQCPECSNDVYVRTRQKIFNSDLLKLDQALAADFFEELVNFGATLNDFNRTRSELKQRWGFDPNPYDIVWSVSNELIVKGPNLDGTYNDKNELLQHAKMITFSQALYQARRGKDPKSYLSSVANYEIDIQSNYGLPIKEMEVLSKGCCTTCEKLNGKKFPISDLKEKQILPIKGCTHKLTPNDKYSWCSCMFLPVIDRNNDI